MVCVLGFTAGVHPSTPVHDPALPDNTSDRKGPAGLHCAQHRASGAAFLVQHDFPSDGEQPQPQRKITAGEPAAFHAAAAL